MSQNLYMFITFVCLCQMVTHVRTTGLYSIIGPGTIRSNFKYNVAVSVHKAEEPCQIKVGITGPSYNDTKTIEVQPMSTQSVEFDVPTLRAGNYNLTAVGLSGIKFENSTELNYKDYKPLVFIQTDKAAYKPGDLVQFRVLFLDANTRPAKIINPITIVINDGAQNRIKQLKDIQLTKGVYTDKFQLSEQPVLGNWEIEVNVGGGENPTTKSFEVAKYVLPKFEVSIDSAKDVAIPDGVIKVTVRSKYTYGKSVKGKATVSIKPSYHYYGDNNNNLEAEKTIDIDGKGHVEFDLTKDLHVSSERTYVPPLKIVAVMKEELTGNQQNATTTVSLHAERYRIESIDTPYTYHPGKPIVFKVVVKNVDGSPVQDAKNKAKLIVDPPRNYFYRGLEPSTEKPDEKSLEFESNLNEHGIATFEFTLPENNNSFYSIKCKFIDTVSYLSSLSKFTPTEDAAEVLKLVVNTEKPQFGKDVSVDVQSADNIPYFVYTLVARGNILKTERVDVPEGRKSHTLKFTPTFAMIPKATLFVHYVYDNNLRFEETDIKFEQDFENSIDITAQPQAKPGEEVKLDIKSDPGSFIGILGVDQSVLLLKSGNDLSKDDIFRSLVDFDTHTPYIRGYGRYPGQESGLVTMTNANYPYSDDATLIYFTPAPIPEEELLLHDFDLIAVAHDLVEENFREIEYFAEHLRTKPTRPPVRTDYANVWMCTDAAMSLEANSDANGFTLTKKIPDTITSWVLTGFSLNPKTGLALTENPTKIQVFQPFFVSTNLPYSVKRGEVISIPVVIFNYMDKTLDAEVTMDNSDKEFDFTEATNEIEEHALDEVKRVKRVTVPSNTGRSVSFMIRPKKVGQTTLKISAVTPLAGDAVHQTLKVEPEGVTQFENRAVFINLNGKSEYRNKLAVDIPAEAVPDSEYIEFSIVGDLLGPTIKNLDKLVRMPYGCGEQNMVNFVPNILVLKYFETIQKDVPNIVEKAKKFLEIGYQRELTYKHDDGSYSAFGKSDVAGSTWLTAYVVRSFHQAAKYTDIDPKVIVEGLDFLAASQADNGSFPEHGKLFDSAHQNELGLTAFVLLAFFENVEYIAKYQEQIDKGVKFLLANVDKSDDQYALSISVLALQMAKNPSADKLLAKLQTLAKQENDRKWWSKENVKADSGDKQLWRWRPSSNAVEITSYVLLALLHQEAAETALPIVKWLISQRNSNGGFSSTQDTVVGLQALIKFAEKAGSGVGDMSIDFVSSGGLENKGSVKANRGNSLVLQTHVLPKSTRQVEFSAKGTGSAMVQLSYRYNLADKDKTPSFQVKATVKDDVSSQKLNVEVCAEYVPLPGAEGKGKQSNMAVMEVALPSGYTADADSFDKIESVDDVKRTESKNSDSMVIVYFDSLTAGEVKCVPVEASKTHAVAKQKPAAISVYDYYDTSRRATEYYQVKSSLCDICDGEDCGAACTKQ